MLSPNAPRRSVLYVPAANARAMEKTRSLAADAVIFDLEDAVAPAAKAEARAALASHFAAWLAAPMQRVIRVNGAATEWGEADLATAIACRPDGILLPKVEDPAQILALHAALAGAPVAIWAMIETPLGIVNIRDIASLGAQAGLACLVAGTNDIRREMGLPMAGSRATIAHWLATLVIHARAFRLPILDGVFNDFRDADGFRAECEEGVRLGFDGKTLIHPSQVELANTLFSPTEEALQDARAIVAAFAAPENQGRGVITLNGQMVELLHLEMAKAVIAKAGSR